MNISETNWLVNFLMTHVTKYNHNKYWKRREYVINPAKGNIIKKIWYLY